MTQSKLFAVASLLAMGLLSVTSQAQQPPAATPPASGLQGGQPATGAQAGRPPAAQQPGQQAGQTAPPYTGAPGSEQQPQEAGGPPAPVAFVTSIEVLRSTRAGGLDVIRVRGLATSGNWSEPHLIPITRGEGRDGMLDMVFEATPPSGAEALGPFMVVEAILPVESGHPYKGVRVRGGMNALSLKELPGYAEAAAPKEDCSKCLGKYFVAKGATAPATATAENTVKEADLPYLLRVIKPTDGIATYAFDPNRLTLVLSEDGRIIDAAWD
ncbi:hypothetical protein BH11PSE3_BH11PSE3_39490 [soil metagenome]